MGSSPTQGTNKIHIIMEFRLLKASDWDFEETITINTLEDLKEL